jgi:hypothetical protein
MLRKFPARLIESLESRCLLSSVTGLTLLNANTDQSIAAYTSLTNGVTLNLATLPTRNLNIQAKFDSTPKSVRFNYDGNASYNVENRAPFSVGSDRSGDFKSWTPSVGTHTLKVTPYSSADGKGTAGGSMTLTFTVIDKPATPPTPTPPTPPTTFDHVYTAGVGGTYATITEAAAVAGPGDQVLIMPGTYFESLTLTKSGTATKPITFTAKVPGSVTLDGTGRETVVLAYGAQYITLDGINVNHASNGEANDPAAVSVGTGWKLKNMVVENTDGIGLVVYGDNVDLTNITAQFNGRQGISGSGCSYVNVVNCTTRGNNTKGNNPDWDAGAGKWFETDHITIDNMTSYDNVGPGIWFDYHNTNVVIKNSKSYNNRGLKNVWSGNGLRAELNTGSFLVQNNQFYGNSGPQLDIQSSKNVTVTGNTITGTHLALKDWNRGTEFAMSTISITNNRFIASGILTEGGTWNGTSGTTKSITIDRNTYQSGLTYTWNYSATYKSLADVRSKLKFEQNGKTV